MNTNRLINICALVTTICTIGGFAQAADTTPIAVIPTRDFTGASSALYRQLDELRSQNAILTEKVKNAELQNKITNVGQGQGQSGQVQTGLAGGPLGGSGQGNGFQVSPPPQMPQVLLVSSSNGSGKDLSALLTLPGGGNVTVKVGSTITGLGVVKAVSLNEVVVENKKQTVSLPFASDMASQSFGVR